jgi:hypothetical protein
MPRAPAANPQAPRGSRNAQTAVRLAMEGIPLAVIARALLCPLWEVRYACQAAKTKGWLKAVPPQNWPDVASPARRVPKAAARLPVADITDRAEQIRIVLGLQFGESVLLAALLLVDVAEKGALSALVSRRGEVANKKLVDVFACHLRRSLRRHRIAFETVHGVGFRMPLDDREKVRQLLEDSEKRGYRHAA